MEVNNLIIIYIKQLQNKINEYAKIVEVYSQKLDDSLISSHYKQST